MTELKPCPMCGYKKVFIAENPREAPHSYIWIAHVLCPNCKATGGDEGFQTTRESADDIAVKRWNTRVGDGDEQAHS